MTNIQRQLLETIDILIEKRINILKFDKTVKGTITKKLEDNYYELNISGVTRTLKYDNENLREFSSVYVLIPNNDYKNIFILCPC